MGYPRKSLVPKCVRNTLTSDGSPRYLWRAHLCRVRDAWAGLIDYSSAKNEPHKKKVATASDWKNTVCLSSCDGIGNLSFFNAALKAMLLSLLVYVEIYMIYSSCWQLRTVAIWLTQPMAWLLTLLEQHMDRQPPTVVTQATTWWETVIALVKLQEIGLGVHLPVMVR